LISIGHKKSLPSSNNCNKEDSYTHVHVVHMLEPWHRNCAAAGAGLRSCPATWRCHMTAGGGSQNTTTGSYWQFLSFSLFYMLLSIVNTHLCCAAVLPIFSPIIYVITYSDGLCHPTTHSRCLIFPSLSFWPIPYPSPGVSM
jgi:hypothetical protein